MVVPSVRMLGTAPAMSLSMQSLETVIVYPKICASLGGVQMIRAGARKATITLADGSEVKVWRSQLPAPQTWTAFTLAEATASLA